MVQCKNSNFNPSIQEKRFGLDKSPNNKELVKKFNYTMLFMRYYIHSCKLHDKPIRLGDFVNKLLLKYKISPVAQWLEHPTRLRRVVGSNPIWD